MTSFARVADPNAEGTFPYAVDKAVMVAFLRGHHDSLHRNGTLMTWRNAAGKLYLGLQMESLGDTTPATVAQYDDQGSVEFVMPHNVLVRAYARLAWNHMLDTLGEPNERRVVQVWDKPRLRKGEDLPVSHWTFDDKPFVPGEPRTVVGRLTLDAWRNQ